MASESRRTRAADDLSDKASVERAGAVLYLVPSPAGTVLTHPADVL